MSFHELKLSGESKFADDDLKVLVSVVHKYRSRDANGFGREEVHVETQSKGFRRSLAIAQCSNVTLPLSFPDPVSAEHQKQIVRKLSSG